METRAPTRGRYGNVRRWYVDDGFGRPFAEAKRPYELRISRGSPQAADVGRFEFTACRFGAGDSGWRLGRAPTRGRPYIGSRCVYASRFGGRRGLGANRFRASAVPVPAGAGRHRSPDASGFRCRRGLGANRFRASAVPVPAGAGRHRSPDASGFRCRRGLGANRFRASAVPVPAGAGRHRSPDASGFQCRRGLGASAVPVPAGVVRHRGPGASGVSGPAGFRCRRGSCAIADRGPAGFGGQRDFGVSGVWGPAGVGCWFAGAERSDDLMALHAVWLGEIMGGTSGGRVFLVGCRSAVAIPVLMGNLL